MAKPKPLTEAAINALTGADLVRAVCAHVFGLREIADDESDSAEDGRPAFQAFSDGSVHIFNAPELPHSLDPLSDWDDAMAVAANIETRGYHVELRSPFTATPTVLPASKETIPPPWTCGFTPHGITGWNGRPDHSASDSDGRAAILRAALLAAMAEAT